MNQIDGKSVYTVSEINYFAKQNLEQLEVWVIGEVSQIQQNDNWYYNYIKLMDENSVLPAICTRDVLSQIDKLEKGQKILVYGFPTLFDRKGEYKFKILRIEAAGEGLLQKQLEELIKKLKAEGLFDQQHKKEIPLYPKRICVVTSYGSDAWNDFKKHTIDKFPIIKLCVADVRVQGTKSVSQLINLLPKIDQMAFDIVIITRGGGSLEDLAAFNDEKVARTIFNLKTPTVVAIGHEANESLAEWVADRRASTPTDAANIVTGGYNQILEKLENEKTNLISKSNYFFATNLERLDHNYRQLTYLKSYFKDLPHKLEAINQNLKSQQKTIVAGALEKLKYTKGSITRSAKYLLSAHKNKLSEIERSLNLLSPQNTLERGYAIVQTMGGKVVKSVKSVGIGDQIGVKLSDGRLDTIIKSKELND